MIKRPYIAKALTQRIQRQANNRCGYCLASQRFYSCRFSIEHIIPLSRGGTSDEKNLWLSCPACNLYKGAKTHGHDLVTGNIARLFNPRTQIWWENFEYSKEGTTIMGTTPIGRATVTALKLNNDLAIAARRLWVAAQKFPPSQNS